MTVRAIALVGFYRGELVKEGQVLELPDGEFAELRAFNKVDYAPWVDAKAEQVATQEIVAAGLKPKK